jgi:predicted Zn-dependent protease
MLALAPTPVIRRRHLQTLAVGLLRAGDLVRGERAVRSLLEGFPEFAPTWIAYARLLQKQGKTQEALAASNKAIAMGSLPEAIALSEELLNALSE